MQNSYTNRFTSGSDPLPGSQYVNWIFDCSPTDIRRLQTSGTRPIEHQDRESSHTGIGISRGFGTGSPITLPTLSPRSWRIWISFLVGKLFQEEPQLGGLSS